MLKLLFTLLLLTQNIPYDMAIKKITKVSKTEPSKPKSVAKNSKPGDDLKAGDVRKVGKKTTTYSAPKDTTGFGGADYIKRNYVDGATKTEKTVVKKPSPESGKMYPLSTKDSPSMSGKDIMASRSSVTPSPKAKLEVTKVKKK